MTDHKEADSFTALSQMLAFFFETEAPVKLNILELTQYLNHQIEKAKRSQARFIKEFTENPEQAVRWAGDLGDLFWSAVSPGFFQEILSMLNAGLDPKSPMDIAGHLESIRRFTLVTMLNGYDCQEGSNGHRVEVARRRAASELYQMFFL